jgi:hypothetical protein
MSRQAYLLEHVHELSPGSGDYKLIGAFSSMGVLATVLAIAKRLPGFSGSVDGFQTSTFLIEEGVGDDVFIAFATQDDDGHGYETVETIGVYATEALAARAGDGFRASHSEAEYEVEVMGIELDQWSWKEGFVTVEGD